MRYLWKVKVDKNVIFGQKMTKNLDFSKKTFGAHRSKEFLLTFQDLIYLLTGCEEKSCRKLQMQYLWKVKVDKNVIFDQK